MRGDKYQVLVATHFNTGTYHNHFVLNSVSMWDGKKYDCSKREYYKLRRISDELCKENNLTVIENPNRKASRNIYFAEKKGEPTKYNLMRDAIDQALEMSHNTAQFRYVMHKLGYAIDIDSPRRYGTIRSINGSKNTRLFRLGEDYAKASTYQKLRENNQKYYFETGKKYNEFTKEYSKFWVYHDPPTEAYRQNKVKYIHLGRMTTIDVLFFFLAHILGVDQEQKQQKRIPLSPECREAMRKIEHYSELVRLISKEGFKEVEDVKAYVEKKDLELETVSKQREKLRNKLRNARDPEVIKQLKSDRDTCTSVMKKLRKERKIAISIVDETPKIVKLIESERNCQRENDPYKLIKIAGKTVKDRGRER